MQIASRYDTSCLFCTFKIERRLFRQSLGGFEARRSLANASTSSPKTYRHVVVSKSHRSNTRYGRDYRAERSRVNPKDLKTLIQTKLDELYAEASGTPLIRALDIDDKAYREIFGKFSRSVLQSSKTSKTQVDDTATDKSIFDTLRETYVQKGDSGLSSELKYAFSMFATEANVARSGKWDHSQLVDLSHPLEWYPKARQVQRTIHLHVGPTNSGKTYHALKRLEEAKSGVFAGPLRLLAHEVYMRLNAAGKSCGLLTGDDRRVAEGVKGKPKYLACTVEMAPSNSKFEVAVIDEIQMIGDRDRGWAWTRALLGFCVRELHLCGEERAVPLITRLAALMGDKLEIHRYERLSPLKVMETSLRGNLKLLRKGDCVVVFSRLGIHAMKREVEKVTGKRVAIVYGSLPPEIRAQQARLFNDPNNDYDILVASDAIGMGLNLNIKRIIFEATMKQTGYGIKPLQKFEVKQIAGRAGRFRTADQGMGMTRQKAAVSTAELVDVVAPLPPATNLGLVTTIDKGDLPYVQKAMEAEIEPIQTAGLFAPDEFVERFAKIFPPQTPFSYILLRLHELSTIRSHFHLCGLKDQVATADCIHSVKELSVRDRLAFIAAPANLADPGLPTVVQAFARCVASQGTYSLMDISEVNLEILDMEMQPNKEYLHQLETVHKSIMLYLWLSYRFSGVFPAREAAHQAKNLVEKRIDEVLENYNFSMTSRYFLRKRREEAMVKSLKESFAQGDPEEGQSTSKDNELLNTNGGPGQTSSILEIYEDKRPEAATA